MECRRNSAELNQQEPAENNQKPQDEERTQLELNGTTPNKGNLRSLVIIIGIEDRRGDCHSEEGGGSIGAVVFGPPADEVQAGRSLRNLALLEGLLDEIAEGAVGLRGLAQLV